MLNVAKLTQGELSSFPILRPFIASALVLPQSVDVLLQYYAVVLTFTLLVIFIVEVSTDSDESRLRPYIILFIVTFCLFAGLGYFCLPTSGKVAEGLHWQAIIATLFIVTVFLGSFAANGIAARRKERAAIERKKAQSENPAQAVPSKSYKKTQKTQVIENVFWPYVVLAIVDLLLVIYIWLFHSK